MRNILRKIKFILKMFHQYLLNRIISFVPCNFIRKLFLKISGMSLAKKCQIDMGCYFMSPWNISCGSNSHINQGVL